jgi:transposase InsO family protein
MVYYPLLVLCEVLEVSRSGFYKWLRRHNQVTEREIKNHILSIKIKDIFTAHRARYGSIRIRQELLKQGYKSSVKRINRIMKDNKLVSLHTTKFKVVTTDSKHKLPIAENKLNRQFAAEKPNQVWVTDISYIKTVTGWLYLAVVLDLFSKQVVGYETSSRIDNSLALSALNKALYRRSPSHGLLFHSDRGVQFASHDFRDALKRANFTQSMSRKGNCWDNSPAESFFATLKKELIYPLGVVTKFQVEKELFEYIEAYYNTIRMHSTLDYLSPLDYEKLKCAA